MFAIPQLRDSSPVRIKISRCKSYRDKYGISMVERVGSLSGKIEIDDIVIKQPKYSAILISGYDSLAAPIYIRSPEIIDPNMSRSTDKINGSAISIGMDNQKGMTQIGNITVENMMLRESLPRAQSAFYVYDVRKDPKFSPKNISFVNPKSIRWDKKRGSAIRVTKGVKLQGVKRLSVSQ
jgi:hypothetical protein